MIDIHCHILPDFDDGSSSMDESLEMARMAALSGVTQIAATPHFRGTEETLPQLAVIREKCLRLRNAIESANIPLKLTGGAEILCLPDTPELAVRHQLPTYEGTNYILVEFYFDESYTYMDQMLSELTSCGYRPVVAHPERYRVIQRDPLLLRRWARLGYALQLNKGSILGSFGSRPEQTANAILELGLAHLFASDAHSCMSRTPHMKKLTQWAEETCDPHCARILLRENPRRILQGKPLVGME